MLRISPKTFSEIKMILEPFAPKIAEIWPRLIDTTPSPTRNRPFVELGYDELPAEEIDRIFAYSGIPSANTPIGLPLEFVPIRIEQELLIFPLKEFDASLTQVANDIVRVYEKLGSADAYLENRGEEASAEDYLIAGLKDCIRYCQYHKEALLFRW